MRVKFENYIEECSRIEIVHHENVRKGLRIETLENKVCYVECVDEQEAKDLYDLMYFNGYINVSTRKCHWYN